MRRSVRHPWCQKQPLFNNLDQVICVGALVELRSMKDLLGRQSELLKKYTARSWQYSFVPYTSMERQVFNWRV